MGASVGAAASLFASTGPAPVGPPSATDEVGDGAGDRRGVWLRTESPMPTTGSRRIACGDADRPDVSRPRLLPLVGARRSAGIAASIRRAGTRDRAGARPRRRGRARARPAGARRNRWARPTPAPGCRDRPRARPRPASGARRRRGSRRRADRDWRTSPRRSPARSHRRSAASEDAAAARRSGRPNTNSDAHRAHVQNRGTREPEQPARGTTLAHLKRG